MTGEYVMVQKDVQTELTKPDPIGMALQPRFAQYSASWMRRVSQ
jgi:hypothetical protein